HPERHHARPQGVEVVAGVGGPAQPDVARQEPEDQDRRLAGDAAGLAVDVFVGDQVAEDEDGLALEPFDEAEQTGTIGARSAWTRPPDGRRHLGHYTDRGEAEKRLFDPRQPSGRWGPTLPRPGVTPGGRGDRSAGGSCLAAPRT